MRALAEWRQDTGVWARRRAEQAVHWFEEEVRSGLLAQLEVAPETRAAMRAAAARVSAGDIGPDAAAREILARLRP